MKRLRWHAPADARYIDEIVTRHAWSLEDKGDNVFHFRLASLDDPEQVARYISDRATPEYGAADKVLEAPSGRLYLYGYDIGD
jgi:hypothetical protein